jgi:hypothetical protein
VVGTAGGTKFSCGNDGKPFLTMEPRLLLNDNNAEPEGSLVTFGYLGIRTSSARRWNTG